MEWLLCAMLLKKWNLLKVVGAVGQMVYNRPVSAFPTVACWSTPKRLRN